LSLLLRLDNFALDYDPYPVGLIAPIFDPAFYRQLVRSFPPIDLFKFMPQFGNKYSLSERNHPEKYDAFLARNEAWRELHRHVKSPDFIYAIIDGLASRGVDLGIRRQELTLSRRWRKLLLNLRRGRLPVTASPIYSRFEFSMLPAKGGEVIPHTDAARKFITLIVTMVEEGDWTPDWGGGTDILRPKDPAKNFNYTNEPLPYDACEVLKTVHFRPNQAMLFVKTFNSLHGVREMTGPEGVLRRTLTINIERDY